MSEDKFDMDQITMHRQIEPSHPGKLFGRFIVPGLGLAKKEILKRMGISDQEYDNLINGKTDIDENMARKMGNIAGNDPDFWELMQKRYDFWKANKDTYVPTP